MKNHEPSARTHTPRSPPATASANGIGAGRLMPEREGHKSRARVLCPAAGTRERKPAAREYRGTQFRCDGCRVSAPAPGQVLRSEAVDT